MSSKRGFSTVYAVDFDHDAPQARDFSHKLGARKPASSFAFNTQR